MEGKIKVLFICRHNSGRSQMAEAFLREFGGNRFEVESAGMAPAEAINPLVVEVMREEGIDLSGKKPQSVMQMFRDRKLYSHVITVCHEEETKCPVFPGITRRWHRPFPDPARVSGSREEQLTLVRKIRDDIKRWILDAIDDNRTSIGFDLSFE